MKQLSKPEEPSSVTPGSRDSAPVLPYLGCFSLVTEHLSPGQETVH